MTSPAPDLHDAVSRACAMVEGVHESLDAERDVVAVLVEAERLGRLADALRVRAAGALAHDPVAAERLGFTGATDAIASLAGVSTRAARTRLAVAAAVTENRALSGAPLAARYAHLASALADGVVGLESAALITRELDAVAGRVEAPALAAAEQVMVSLASASPGGAPSGVSLDALASEVHQVAATIDPDGARPREERAVRRRAFRIGEQDADGLVPVSGRLLPEVGGLLAGLVEAHRRSPRFRAEGESVDVDDLGAADLRSDLDSRTPDQRRHDAFAEIVAAATAAEGAPRLDGQPVTVVVTVDLRDLAADGLDGDGIGTMAGSAFPVSRAQVRRFIDANGGRLAGIDGNGAVVGITSVQRCFTAAQRLAIAARDGMRCATPGCTSPHYALQVHHVVPAREGGPTDTCNGILLCYWHHRRVDDGPWEYRMVDGRPEVRGPGLLEWTPLRRRRDRAA